MAKNKIKKFNGKDYVISCSLSPEDRGILIESVASAVFNNDTYVPYMFDVAYSINCVAFYTDIELPKIEVETEDGVENVVDYKKSYELIVESEIMDVLDKYIDPDIEWLVQDLIEYRKAEYLKKSKSDELVDALVGLVNTLDDIASNGFKDVDIKEILGLAESLGSKSEAELAKGVLNFQAEKSE